MKVTQNRLDLMETVTITVDGVQYNMKDPLSIQFRDFDARRSATEHRVTQPEVPRPDIISNVEYSTPGFWWFLAAVNGVVDPYDMPEQELIKVPRLLDYYDWFRDQKGT